MKGNEQGHDSLTENFVNANKKKFHVAFEFEKQKSPLIIELSFDEGNKKILPDNKYFDKMCDNLKSKYEFDIEQVVLGHWNKYLESKIKGYHAQISKCPADSYGDYLILVLFLKIVQRHWAKNKFDQKNIWYNAGSLQKLSQHFPRLVLDLRSNSQNTVGGEIFNNCADYLKSNLVRIVFIDDFPMEVIPQLFKLQNFCSKSLEVDVTPFNRGEMVCSNENDNAKRKEKVLKEVKKILDIENNVPVAENSVGSNLPEKKAVSRLKFVGQGQDTNSSNQLDWFRYLLCGCAEDSTVYAENDFQTIYDGFDPDINMKKYAPFLYTQTGPNSIETVPYTTEHSNNLNEGNKPESDTVEAIHDPHTEESISVETFKGESPGLNDSKDKEAPENESSNEMDGKFKDSDPDINKKKLDPQTVPNSIETAPYTAKPSNNLNGNNAKKTVMMHDPITGEYITFGYFKSERLGLRWSAEEEIKRWEKVKRKREGFKEINEDADNNTKDENKTKTQKSKGQLILTWIFLILCGIIFVGTPLGAYLSGILFAWEIGIPVVGIMIFSGLGFGFLLAGLKQQNSDISLSSDNKDTDYPKTSVEYNPQETESPLLENRTKNKDEKSN